MCEWLWVLSRKVLYKKHSVCCLLIIYSIFLGVNFKHEKVILSVAICTGKSWENELSYLTLNPKQHYLKYIMLLLSEYFKCYSSASWELGGGKKHPQYIDCVCFITSVWLSTITLDFTKLTVHFPLWLFKLVSLLSSLCISRDIWRPTVQMLACVYL